MQPILFRIPNTPNGLPVYGFGMMLFVTFIATTWLATRRAVKAGISREVIQDVAVWIFLGGILGARLTYLIFDQKMRDPGKILLALPRIWDGGIIFYGSVAGAVVAYFIGHWLFFRHKPNVTILRMADVIAPTIALGMIIGRMGCLLNGCCYGQVACEKGCPSITFPLSAPSAGVLTRAGYQTACGFLVEYERFPPFPPARVTHVQPHSPAERSGLRPGDIIVEMNGQEITSARDILAVLEDPDVPRDQRDDVTLTVERGEDEIVPQFPIFVEKKKQRVELPSFRPRTLGLQPTQIYESISMALLLFLLLAFEPFKRHDGQVMGLMMIGYSIHRYVNEILRSDARPVGFESNVSVLLLAAGLGLMVWLWWRARQAPPAPPQARLAPVKAVAGSV